jgi:hypothetical protein
MAHPLHEEVAMTFDRLILPFKTTLSCEKDGACGGNKQLTFFLSFVPSRESAVSKVDLVVLKNEKIKLVCEIEETGFNPGKFFGKVFSTASAKVCRLVDMAGHKYINFDEEAIFIQIVSTKLFDKDNSFKEKQGQLIENEIFHKIGIYKSWITRYRMIYGDIVDFNTGKKGDKELERIIEAL